MMILNRSKESPREQLRLQKKQPRHLSSCTSVRVSIMNTHNSWNLLGDQDRQIITVEMQIVFHIRGLAKETP
jgi:hypothetical protein